MASYIAALQRMPAKFPAMFCPEKIWLDTRIENLAESQILQQAQIEPGDFLSPEPSRDHQLEGDIGSESHELGFCFWGQEDDL